MNMFAIETTITNRKQSIAILLILESQLKRDLLALQNQKTTTTTYFLVINELRNLFSPPASMRIVMILVYS